MGGTTGDRHPEDREIVFLTGTYCLLPGAEKLRESPGVELDLGCGAGSFTVALARRFPERQILAADVMVGRLRKLVRRRQREGVENLTLYRTEARYLVGLALPDGVLDRIHLLCPDPWPKGRHRGHRLLTSDFAAQLHRVLKPDGVFHFSSDDDAYYDAVERVLPASGLFAVCAPDPLLADLKSDFERRWNEEGKVVRHLYCRRLPLPPHTVGH